MIEQPTRKQHLQPAPAARQVSQRDTPNLSTLPRRLRYAVGVLYEAHARDRTSGDRCPEKLLAAADKWEAENLMEELLALADKWETEDLVEELARELCDSSAKAPIRRTEEYWELAQHLVESGWRKK